MALLSTDDSQKRMRAVLTIHPTLAYPFFSLIRPLFLRVLPKGDRICEGLLYLRTTLYIRTYLYLGKKLPHASASLAILDLPRTGARKVWNFECREWMILGRTR